MFPDLINAAEAKRLSDQMHSPNSVERIKPFMRSVAETVLRVANDGQIGFTAKYTESPEFFDSCLEQVKLQLVQLGYTFQILDDTKATIFEGKLKSVQFRIGWGHIS